MALDTYSSEFHVSYVRDNTVLLDHYDGKYVERKPAIAAPKIVACECAQNAECVAYLRWREFGEPLMGSEEWATTARGLSIYSKLGAQWLDSEESEEAKATRRYFAFLNRVRRAEDDCPANTHYVDGLTETWYGTDTTTSSDDDKVREDAERWEREHFLVGRSHWPLICEPAEEDRGYLSDYRLTANEERLEREYGETKTEEREVVTATDKGWMNAPTYEKRTVEVVSAVEREYRRRKATIERGKRRGEDLGVVAGPWMNSRTYRYLLERQRRDNLVKLLRGEIAKELRARDLDPKWPSVAARVRQIVARHADTLSGYQAALQTVRRLPTVS